MRRQLGGYRGKQAGASVAGVSGVSASRRDRNSMLLEAGMTLASELSLPTILQRLVELAVELTGARYGALGVLGRDGMLVDFITTGVTEDERRAIGHPPVGRGILGVLIRDVRPLRLADLTQDPRSVGFPPNHPPMRSFLGAPVVARGWCTATCT
jgi:GAF domain-containing protein